MKTDHFSKRSVLLDCIRTVAITLVICFHVATRFDVSALDTVAKFTLHYGFYGVDLFFPLSGFLITRFLVQSNRPDFVTAFFIRRFFRILPLYLLAVTVFLIASKATGYDAENVDRIWINYFFLTGWYLFFDGASTVPYTITWSLSVEEFAYILFGLFALISRKRFTLFVVFCIVAPTLYRFYLNSQGADFVYFFPPARIDAIAIGGLTAILMQDQQRPLLLWYGLIAVALLAIVQMGDLWHQTFFFTEIAIVTCFLIILFERHFAAVKGRIVTEIARVGFYSYFIYLFHFFVIYGVVKVLDSAGMAETNFWVVTFVCYAITYALAILSYRFFEGPLIEFGRMLERKVGRKADAGSIENA